MNRQVALLRAVNVGMRRLAMADLRAIVAGLGGAQVATYLRSGNVVYDADEAPDRMAARIAEALAGALGFDVPVVVRTGEGLREVVAGNPLADEAARDPRRLQVVFLSDRPPAGVLDGLEDEDLGDERIRVGAREVYVWAPGGVARSPALDLLARRRLPVVATARNWRTVERLAEMAGA